MDSIINDLAWNLINSLRYSQFDDVDAINYFVSTLNN